MTSSTYHGDGRMNAAKAAASREPVPFAMVGGEPWDTVAWKRLGVTGCRRQAKAYREQSRVRAGAR